jgi:copper transport protein
VIHRSLRRRGRVIRLALAVWVACCLVLLAAPAGAHASLVSTDPAEGSVLDEAPEVITLTFNEPVTLSAASAVLYDATGDEVPAQARSSDEVVSVVPGEDLADGTYVLSYRVISTDAHPISGSLIFSVGAPSESVVAQDPGGTDPAVRWVHGILQGGTYLALLLAAGLAAFLVLVLPRESSFAGPRATLIKLLRGSAVLAGVGAVLLVPVGALYRQGLGLGDLATRLPWTGWVSEDGLLAALVIAGLATTASVLPRPAGRWGAREILVLEGIAVALGALALVGHTRSYGPGWLVVGADIAHVVAGAVWFGGLVALAVCLRGRYDEDGAGLVARFSQVAGLALVVVAVAGVILGWRIVGSWSELVSTPYGRILLAKTALVVLVAAGGAWNRYRLLPAVRAGAAVRTVVRLEALTLVVVVALTGFLVNQVPRSQVREPRVATGPVSVMAMAGDVHVLAHVEPARVGENTIYLHLETAGGSPLESYADPTVSLRSAGLDLGSRPVNPLGAGVYESVVLIPSPGVWELQVSVRLDEFTNPVVSLDVEIAP